MAGTTPVTQSARTKRAVAALAASTDNAALDAATVAALNRHAEAIKLLVRSACRGIIKIGHRLTKAQELAGHGNWLRWLDREFSWSEQTARNYMRVYEMASIHNAVVDLDLPLRSLYLLAAPSTPEEARKEVIDRAASGEKISFEQVKVAVDGATRNGKRHSTMLPSYVPDDPNDIINNFADQFKGFDRHVQSRCLRKLTKIYRGEC